MVLSTMRWNATAKPIGAGKVVIKAGAGWHGIVRFGRKLHNAVSCPAVLYTTTYEHARFFHTDELCSLWHTTFGCPILVDAALLIKLAKGAGV